MARRPPHIVLLAGDIFNLGAAKSDVIRQAAAPLQALIDAAQSQGAGVVAVTGDKEHDPLAWRIRRALDWGWLLRRGQTERVHGVWVTGLPGSAPGDTRKGLKGQPSILLTHRDEAPPGADAFSYCALGHHHQYRREGNAARPGSPVSLWDGPGKAWPTYFIKGTLWPSGAVSVRPVLLERPPYSAPATRQFFTEHLYQDQRSGVLVLVHAPPAVRADWTKKPIRDGEPRLAAFHYHSLRQMRDIVKGVAEGCPDDVFVTPSPPASIRKHRIVCYGRQLLHEPGLLSSFLTDIHKKDDGTQTSDRAGVAASRDPRKMVTLENLQQWCTSKIDLAGVVGWTSGSAPGR
jgi:hypothetical protein